MTFLFNPFALRMAKTLWSFGRSECNRGKFMSVKLMKIKKFYTSCMKLRIQRLDGQMRLLFMFAN